LIGYGSALLFGLISRFTTGPFFAIIQSTVEPDMHAEILSILSSVGGRMAPIVGC